MVMFIMLSSLHSVSSPRVDMGTSIFRELFISGFPALFVFPVVNMPVDVDFRI